MPYDPHSAIEITAFNWVPDFARTYVRDIRPRWALEEAELPYRTRLLDAAGERPEAYYLEQPFGQVPAMRWGELEMFESGAIVLQLAEHSDALMPSDEAGRARTKSWLLAALNSIEPEVMNISVIDLFYPDEEWAKLGRPAAVEALRGRLERLSNWFGDKDYLEGRFTVADIIMATVLREADRTPLVREHANLAAYLERCTARPAFQRAVDAQMADFTEKAPEGFPA